MLEVAGSSLTLIASAGNGTTLQGPAIGGSLALVNFTLDTNVLRFGPVGNFDSSDGPASVILINATQVATVSVGSGALIAHAIIPFGTPQAGGWAATADDWFGAIGDYDGDGKDEALVVGPWGIAIFRLFFGAQATLAYFANGAAIGGWTLDTSVDQFGPVGDYDGDGKAECLIRNTTGFALLKFEGSRLTASGKTTVGTIIAGWRCGTMDRMGPAADFNGDHRTELLV